jgi:thiol-disulfide isomerase/thioredoxin
MKKAVLTAIFTPFMLVNVHAGDESGGGCGFDDNTQGQSIGSCQPNEEPMEVILTGELGFEQLRQQPGYEENFAAYEPDAGAVSALQAVTTPTELVVIVGTWCPDCHRETPRLAKVLATAGNPNISVRYIGIDRSRRDPQGLAAAYAFDRIPTILVYQGGTELGRIVEAPEQSLEQDLLRIFGG